MIDCCVVRSTQYCTTSSGLAPTTSTSSSPSHLHSTPPPSSSVMPKKRKRSGHNHPASHASIISSPRRFKSAPNGPTHPVISLYYRDLFSLRQYLLCCLPLSSKSRRRRIASLGASGSAEHDCQPLVHLLDTTLVGVLKQPSPKLASERQQAYRAFTQSQSRSILVSTDTGPVAPQSEVLYLSLKMRRNAKDERRNLYIGRGSR